MTPATERFSEPWSTTLLRTVGLALAIGAGVGIYEHRITLVLPSTVLALWFTLGGHFVDLWCRNALRPRLPSRPVALLARLAAWFVGGSVLYGWALVTRTWLTGPRRPPVHWWVAGLLFVGAELVVHLGLRIRAQPSVYDGRG
ncbi:MAG TPA: hypothetical protein VI160_07870 [Gemmatimonadales bacterium]